MGRSIEKCAIIGTALPITQRASHLQYFTIMNGEELTGGNAPEGAISSEATSAASSKPSSAQKNPRNMFRYVPVGINIFNEAEIRSYGLVIARNVPQRNFFELAEGNPHLNDLWLRHGEVIYTEHTHSRVHPRLCVFFARATELYNRFNGHAIRVTYDSGTLLEYGEDTAKAGDVLLTSRARFDAGIPFPNVVGEIGYFSPLDELVNNVPIYLNDSLDNHTELFFVVKTRYPFDAAHPDQFQMVFILYDRRHAPRNQPILIVSCGTLPLSEPVIAQIAALTGITAASHPEVHRGHGYGGPPCDQANAVDPMYTVTFGGARIMSINRDGELPPAIVDPALYDFSVSL